MRRNAASAAGTENRREEILARLEQAAAPLAPSLSVDVRERCLADDDCFDSFLLSLVACSAASGRTLPPGPTERPAAERDARIHLPAPDSLENGAPGVD